MGGASRIAWTALDRFAIRHGIDDPDDFTRFVALIGAADSAYLEHLAEEAKSREKAPPRRKS